MPKLGSKPEKKPVEAEYPPAPAIHVEVPSERIDLIPGLEPKPAVKTRMASKKEILADIIGIKLAVLAILFGKLNELIPSGNLLYIVLFAALTIADCVAIAFQVYHLAETS